MRFFLNLIQLLDLNSVYRSGRLPLNARARHRRLSIVVCAEAPLCIVKLLHGLAQVHLAATDLADRAQIIKLVESLGGQRLRLTDLLDFLLNDLLDSCLNLGLSFLALLGDFLALSLY